MSDYFSGEERLETFTATGAPMRMANVSSLAIADYQVLRNFVNDEKWDLAISYLNAFHGQNQGMLSLLFDWCLELARFFAEATSEQEEIKLRDQAISDFKNLVYKMRLEYTDQKSFDVIEEMSSLFKVDSFFKLNSSVLLSNSDLAKEKFENALKTKNKIESLALLSEYHHQALIRHDSLITFIYSYPTTIMKTKGEKLAIEISNESILRNPSWNGMWELTRVLTPTDLAAFLAEHLRFHFSGKTREGSTQIIEDDQKIRLIFDPCGSGGALRRRLGKEISNFKEKHQLGWNKCGEVNLYCSHCALNEKKSIDLFGYPKLVVEFSEDPNKPCGWTMYKNPDDIPLAVYERLGINKK